MKPNHAHQTYRRAETALSLSQHHSGETRIKPSSRTHAQRYHSVGDAPRTQCDYFTSNVPLVGDGISNSPRKYQARLYSYPGLELVVIASDTRNVTHVQTADDLTNQRTSVARVSRIHSCLLQAGPVSTRAYFHRLCGLVGNASAS